KRLKATPLAGEPHMGAVVTMSAHVGGPNPPQKPLTHPCMHTLPHWPQLALSFARSVSQPSVGFMLQSPRLEPQIMPHPRLVHDGIENGRRGPCPPQPPQFEMSLVRLTQTGPMGPGHWASPGPQGDLQTPAVQGWFKGHTTPGLPPPTPQLPVAPQWV